MDNSCMAKLRSSLAFYRREMGVAYRTIRSLMPHLLGEPFMSEQDRADLIHILLVFKRIMDPTGLIYWLDYGTLLGAWRWGNPLPWDHDADIGYMAGQWHLLQEQAPAFAAEGMEFNIFRVGYGAVYLDLYPWIERDGAMVYTEHIDYQPGFLKAISDHSDIFPSQWINPLAEIAFAGEYFKCPNQVETLLRKRYGNIDILVPHRVKALLYPKFYRYYLVFRRYRPQIRQASSAQPWTTVTNPALLKKFGINA